MKTALNNRLQTSICLENRRFFRSMKMTTLKPSENKLEEFRKYLERTGVMDSLTKVLVSLYEEAETPGDALEFIRNKLSEQPNGASLDTIKKKLEDATQQIATLEKENAELKGESPRADEPVAAPDEPPAEEPQTEEAP